MIGSTRQVTVYAYSQPADLRRGFDGLSALVREGMSRSELSGDLYVFVSRDRLSTVRLISPPALR